MAFTVPSSWLFLDGTHNVAPRAPIVGGKTGSYAFDALIGNHHRVRATRMACSLSMGNADAWTNTAGPGGGVADWASFGKTKIETQDGFDGRLNVTVWCEDCESAGGVYVAVFNTSSVLQASVTLTNTTSGTKQERTGSITGLSASTEYLIEVRFAANAATTPAAKLYGVLVEPRELTASTIDDKLNDSRANDDESASSLIPFRVREHLIASMRERMPHCTHTVPEESKLQMSAPTVSTHPDEWWGIPILVPVPYGADQIKVRLRYEVASADVKVRLRVINGSIGTATTLTPTAATLSADISVRVRRGSAREELLMLSFQSQRGSTTGVTDSWTSPVIGGSRLITYTLDSGTLAAHSVVDSGGQPAYVGSTSGGTARVWPTVWATDQNADVYALGKITIYSIGLEVTADASDLNGFPIPTTSPMTVGKSMRYDLLHNLDSAGREIYSNCAQWYSMRPSEAVQTGFFGVSASAEAPAAGALVTRREDSEGIRVWLLVISSQESQRNVDTVVTIQNASASVTEDTTISATVGRPIFEVSDAIAVARFVPILTDGGTSTNWGSRDLIAEEEAALLGVIEGRVPWPSGSSVGDTLEVTCSIGKNVEHVFGAFLQEWVTPSDEI